MPVVKRQILPVQIARAQLQKTVKDDLEATAVNGIAGLIKQVLFRWKKIRYIKVACIADSSTRWSAKKSSHAFAWVIFPWHDAVLKQPRLHKDTTLKNYAC